MSAASRTIHLWGGAPGRVSAASAVRCAGALRRRGLILPVMLVILLLLALLSASFAFHVQADFSAGQAMADRFQTRLAAEAGIQKVMYMLRKERDNPAAWYNNPQEFDQALVWTPGIRPEEVGKPKLMEDLKDSYAYRFSIVADDPLNDDPEAEANVFRFGITDESAKLNINVADEQQLTTLLSQVVAEGVDVQPLVQAMLDWRDEDEEPHEFGAETEYYQSLETPYRCKNARFDSVEELLMVKGFDGRILYGEDYNRNGLLDYNEDDAEVSFPVDDGDGVLNRGLLPYITVYSRELLTANDNKPRTYLFGDKSKLRPKLEEVFDDAAVVDFIMGATKSSGTEKTNSLADLLEPQVVDDRETQSPLRGDLAVTLFDKFTLNPSPQAEGLINVGTAPPQVLRCIPGMTAESIAQIIQKRATLAPRTLQSTAWLVTEGIMDADGYRRVERYITARGRQFTIEAIGFADHSGVYTRLQAVVDMRGPIAQIIYYRDLTRLGLAYPIRGKEGERSIVRQAGQSQSARG